MATVEQVADKLSQGTNTFSWALNCAARMVDQVLAYSQYNMPDADESMQPGRVVSIVHHGEGQQLLTGYGQAVCGQAESRMTPDTPVNAASITKCMTNILIGQLLHEGRVSLDVPVANYLGDWFTSTVGERKLRSITTRQLMTHRSGLPSDVSDFGRLVFVDAEQFKVAIQNTFLVSRPGETYRYSNMGYMVLQHLIEALDQKPYGAVLQERILDPLGMTSTYNSLKSDIANRVARHYGRCRKGARETIDPWSYYPGGQYDSVMNLITTARDMATFSKALLDLDKTVLPDRGFAQELGLYGFQPLRAPSSPGFRKLPDPRLRPPTYFQGRSSYGLEALLTVGESNIAVFHAANHADAHHINAFAHDIFLFAQKASAHWFWGKNEWPKTKEYRGLYTLGDYAVGIESFGQRLVRWSYAAARPSESLSVLSPMIPELYEVDPQESKSSERIGEVVDFLRDTNGEIVGMKFGADTYKKVPLSSANSA